MIRPVKAKPSDKRSAIAFAVDGHRRSLGLMAATAFVGGISEALFLVTITRAAFAITDGNDRVGIVSGWYVSVNATLLLALAFVLVRVAMSGFAAWQSARLTTAVVSRVRKRLARAFLHSSWDVQQRQRAGSLQELIGGYSNQTAGMMSSLSQVVVSAANLVALLGLAVAVDPTGAVVMVISVGCLGMLLRPLRAAVRRRSRAATVASMGLATAVNETSQLGMELHVFNVQQQAEDRLGHYVDEVRERSRQLQFASGSSSTIYTGLAYLALVAAMAVVAASPAASLSSLGAVMLVMLRSLSYGQSIQGAYVGMSSSAPAIEELQLVQQRFEEGGRKGVRGHVAGVSSIAAEHVTFHYLEGEEVLRDVSFVLAHREIVGIVGPSGGGKSTLVQLLLGLREPQLGRILADGQDIRFVDRTEWSRKVTFVPQEARLITGTIADNIRFLRDDVTDSEIEMAARMAHLHDEIMSMPEGYQRLLGGEDGRLSGGQQQRLCIARALVERPDVMILDEPTSALDVRSEHLIRTTLLGLKDRMTVIVIAHRLSTLDICDRIMVIQAGEMKAFDTPSNLERSNEFYREALALSGMR